LKKHRAGITGAAAGASHSARPGQQAAQQSGTAEKRAGTKARSTERLGDRKENSAGGRKKRKKFNKTTPSCRYYWVLFSDAIFMLFPPLLVPPERVELVTARTGRT
jgi:hypothetical protein